MKSCRAFCHFRLFSQPVMAALQALTFTETWSWKPYIISTIGSLVEANNYSKSQEKPMFSRARCSFVRVKPPYFIGFSAETQHCFLFYSWISLFLVSNHQVFHLKPPRLFLKSQILTQKPIKKPACCFPKPPPSPIAMCVPPFFPFFSNCFPMFSHFFPFFFQFCPFFSHFFPFFPTFFSTFFSTFLFACARTKSSSSRSACGHCKALPQQLMAAPQARLSTFEI